MKPNTNAAKLIMLSAFGHGSLYPRLMQVGTLTHKEMHT